MKKNGFVLEFTLDYPTGTGARYRVSGGDLEAEAEVIGVVSLHKDFLAAAGHETIPASFSAVITLPKPISRAAHREASLQRHAALMATKRAQATEKEPGTVERDGEVIYTPSRGHVQPNGKSGAKGKKA